MYKGEDSVTNIEKVKGLLEQAHARATAEDIEQVCAGAGADCECGANVDACTLRGHYGRRVGGVGNTGGAVHGQRGRCIKRQCNGRLNDTLKGINTDDQLGDKMACQRYRASNVRVCADL